MFLLYVVHISINHCIIVAYFFYTSDPSISSYSQSQKVALDDNAPLPIDINTIDTSMSPG